MGRPPKNQDQVNFNADDLLNEIEALKAENQELKNQAEFQNSVTDGIIKDWTEKYNEVSEINAQLRNVVKNREFEPVLQISNHTPRATVSGIKITVDHSVFYKGTSYAKDSENSIIENPPESDIDELLKFGELV